MFDGEAEVVGELEEVRLADDHASRHDEQRRIVHGDGAEQVAEDRLVFRTFPDPLECLLGKAIDGDAGVNAWELLQFVQLFGCEHRAVAREAKGEVWIVLGLEEVYELPEPLDEVRLAAVPDELVQIW